MVGRVYVEPTIQGLIVRGEFSSGRYVSSTGLDWQPNHDPPAPFVAKYIEIILTTCGGENYTGTLPVGLDMDAWLRHRDIDTDTEA